MKRNIYKRKSNRFKFYDYSNPGYYFVTICTHHFISIFGCVTNEKMFLNKYGKLVEEFWLKIPDIFNNVSLDYYVIMPNHIHGIIIIDSDKNSSNMSISRDQD